MALTLAIVLPLASAVLAVAPGSAAPEPLVPLAEGELTLLSIGRQTVALVDAHGTPFRVWTVPSGNVHDVELMPNGHLLVTVGGYEGLVPEVMHVPYDWPLPQTPDPAGSWVVELDGNGVPVWWLTHAGGVLLTWTHDADYLEETDTFLLADTTVTADYPDRVVEVDRAGNVVWAYYPAEDDYPNDADRLANGNTLVSLRNANQIVEVDPAGNVVWTGGNYRAGPFDGIHNPDRLPNGNTIVADSNNDRIVEIDAAGNVVWEYGGTGILRWPRDADVLPNGNVLITDSHRFRVIEVTRAGEIVWEHFTPALVLNYDSDRVNLPPTIAVAEPAPGATVPSPVRFDVTATDPSLAGATYRLYDVTLGEYVDPEPLALPGAPFTRALASGHEYRLEVEAWDAGGEGGGWPQDDSVVERARKEVSFHVD